jgi:peptidoglycan-associated lipoprotein
MKSQRVMLPASLILALALTACRSRTEVRDPEIPPVATPVPESGAMDSSAVMRERERREAEERARLQREQAARTTLTEPIHFALDRWDLDAEARRALEEKLAVLRTRPEISLRIEGHADERGSTEYNMALGMRRAAAARRYLVQRDIPEHRIEIASFGEERPVCTDAREACWYQNRRAAFVITSR